MAIREVKFILQERTLELMENYFLYILSSINGTGISGHPYPLK